MNHDAAAWSPPENAPPPREHNWTRVYRRNAREAHIQEVIYSAHVRAPRSWDEGGWYGTGSQEEYDRAQALPLCPKCYVITDLYRRD